MKTTYLNLLIEFKKKWLISYNQISEEQENIKKEVIVSENIKQYLNEIHSHTGISLSQSEHLLVELVFN